MRALLRRLARHAGAGLDVPEPQPLPRLAGYLPGIDAVDLERLASRLPAGRPVVPVIFYRSLLLAADTAAIDALCEALAARGSRAGAAGRHEPQGTGGCGLRARRAGAARSCSIITTTAFAAGGEPGELTPLDGPGVPVFQVVLATTKRTAWRDSPRGLGAADLAMHVVLPELDGRVLAGAVAFKDALPALEGLAFTAFANRPEPDRIAAVADRVAALVHLAATARAERRVAVLMPDYPGAPGRAGYAVGLDVPASVIALLADLAEAGYGVADAPDTPKALLDALNRSAGWVERSETHLPTDEAHDGFRKGSTHPTSDTCDTNWDDVRLPLHDYARLIAELHPRCKPASRGLGRSGRRSRPARWCVPFPGSPLRQHHRRAAARSRPRGRPACRLSRRQRCRRAMRSSLSRCGCAMWRRPVRWCTWARTARSSGSPARPSP